jgi:hypothetical protein
MDAYHAVTPPSLWRDLAAKLAGPCRADAVTIARGLERRGYFAVQHPEYVDWRGVPHPAYTYIWLDHVPGEPES